jgi:hypothetical protein
VNLELATAEDLKKLRANPEKKLRLVSFWNTQCGTCAGQSAGIEAAYRMYSVRGLELVTVAADPPDARVTVQQALEKQRATSRNLLFASADTTSLRRAFDPEWNSVLPYTVLIAPDGKMVYRKLGAVDLLELRRTILANFDWEYEGFSQYWEKKSEGTSQ